MAATIHLAASALAGLEEIRTWYADQGAPEDGARPVARIIERIEHWRTIPTWAASCRSSTSPFCAS